MSSLFHLFFSIFKFSLIFPHLRFIILYFAFLLCVYSAFVFQDSWGSSGCWLETVHLFMHVRSVIHFPQPFPGCVHTFWDPVFSVSSLLCVCFPSSWIFLSALWVIQRWSAGQFPDIGDFSFTSLIDSHGTDSHSHDYMFSPMWPNPPCQCSYKAVCALKIYLLTLA